MEPLSGAVRPRVIVEVNMDSFFNRRWERAAWLVVTGIVVAFLHFLTVRAGFGFDACDYYVAAEDWLAGARPYHDFFQTKTPGILFLTAMLFKTFSSHAGWLPWYTTAVNVGWAAAAVWALAPLIGRRLAIWVFPLSLAVSLCCMVNFWNTEQPMTLFAVLGIGCWLRNEKFHRIELEILAGVFIGVATLFKLFAVLSMASLVFLIFLSSRRARFRSAAWLAAGFAVVMLAVGIWAGSDGILGDLWTQSVVMPIFDYPAHTEYLADFAKRAGWFVVPMCLAMAWSAVNGLVWRDADRAGPGFVLAVLGLPYLVPLFKNQAAHYLIPFIPFAVAWCLWTCGAFAERLSAPVGRKFAAVASIAGLAVFAGLVSYKKSSLERILFHDPSAGQKKTCGEIAKWVGRDERVIFLNAGPYPHIALYWMTGERPYPWPFTSLTAFVKKPIQQFGFEKFYGICSDPKTRMLGLRLDVPMDQTLAWVYSPAEMKKLEQLIQREYRPMPEFPGVFLRVGSAPQTSAFRRGPFKGDRF